MTLMVSQYTFLLVSPSHAEYKLEALAAAAGVSPRTVRYYVQRGLLPAPTFRAKDTSYDHGHLLALRAIKKLQESFLPLDAIAVALAGKSHAELEAIAAHGLPTHARPTHVEPAPPRVEPRTTSGELATRYVLAPGVELTVLAAAGPHARALVEKILSITHTSRPSHPGGNDEHS